MSGDKSITSLEQLLDRINSAVQEERVSFRELLKAVGRRSFGALLLVAGLITLAPLVGDIPGVPTVIGIFVFLLAIQLLFGSEHFWLPRWLLERTVAKRKLCKALGWMRKPARFVDKLIRPRLTVFTNGVGTYVIAALCLVIAALMPVMEVIPFSANAAGAALTAFGLSLIARDGLLALLAFILIGGTIGLLGYNLLF